MLCFVTHAKFSQPKVEKQKRLLLFMASVTGNMLQAQKALYKVMTDAKHTRVLWFLGK